MLLLSVGAIKFCCVLNTNDTDNIAINKLCKLNQVFYHVLSYKSTAGLSGLS